MCEGRSSAAAEAERAKVLQSKAACQAVGWDFSPFGLDATGGLGPAARLLCKRLAKALAMRAGANTATLSENVRTQISLALAKGRGELLCADTPLPLLGRLLLIYPASKATINIKQTTPAIAPATKGVLAHPTQEQTPPQNQPT